MKHRLIALFLCLNLVSIFPMIGRAAFYEDQRVLQHVVDQADILKDQENIELEALARELSESSGFEILIAAVEDMDGYSAGEYASSLNSGHWWDSDNAILFLLAMEEREWYIATFGDAIYIFTDYGLDRLGEAAALSFSEGNYYEGFSAFLFMIPEYVTAWQDGAPIDNFDYDSGYRSEVVYYDAVHDKTLLDVLPGSLLIGAITAMISVLIMRSVMNTKRRQYSASDYLRCGSFQLRTQHDIFLYSNVSKTRRQQNTGGTVGHRGGGSSIHRSSGGRSHGGRGGKF